MGGELSGYAEVDITGKGLQGARKRVGVNEYIYMKVPATYAAGRPLVVTHDGDEEVMVSGVAPATLTVYQEIAVNPTLQGATAGFQWCQTRGICNVLTDGTTDIAKDDFLEVLNTETALTKDSTARSVNSVGIACEAQTDATDTLTSVQLLGDRVIIAAT